MSTDETVSTGANYTWNDEELSRRYLAQAKERIADGDYDAAALKVSMAQAHAILDVSRALWDLADIQRADSTDNDPRETTG